MRFYSNIGEYTPVKKPSTLCKIKEKETKKLINNRTSIEIY